jgi:hypothetical protein
LRRGTIWTVVLETPERQVPFSRWARHVVIVAFAAANAYLALAIGSLALSPWDTRNRATDVLFFLTCGAYATAALALYPFILWRSGRRRVHATALIVAVVAGVAATAVVASMA